MNDLDDPRFTRWMDALEARHLAELTFQEVSRALGALSSSYVERRARLSEGAALSGAGKRAAFALFYGPLHYLIVRHIAAALGAGRERPSAIVDLGCGTGAAGAGFAIGSGASPSLVGIDRSAWALGEAAQTYRELGLKGRTVRGDFATMVWSGLAQAGRHTRGEAGPHKVRESPAKAGHDKTGAGPAKAGSRTVVVAAFALNELDDAAREKARKRLLDGASRGDAVLIVEPLAGFVAPWWGTWRRAFEAVGGRADQWRATIELPTIVRKLDRAAALDHRELTARSIWVVGN